MKLLKIILSLILLMSAVTMAQTNQWESMDGPYFVYDVTDISLGWQGDDCRAYAVGSDFDNRYIYRYDGSTPITEWPGRFEIPDVKYVDASRQNGDVAYATVPEGIGTNEGVHITEDGGVVWNYDPNRQPGNKKFTCIETHPTNSDICFTTAEYNNALETIWRTVDAGEDWEYIGEFSGFEYRETVFFIRIDPRSLNDIENTTIYVSTEHEGMFRNTTGGADGDWEQLDIYGNGSTYTVVDLTFKVIDEQNQMMYALTGAWEPNHEPPYEDIFTYAVWSSSNGESWTRDRDFDNAFATYYQLYDYTDEKFNKILACEDPNGGTGLWVVSDSTVFVYINDIHQEWQYTITGYGPNLCAEIDATQHIPGANIYVGSQISIRNMYYTDNSHSYSISRLDVSAGMNMSDVVSLDWVQHCQPGNDFSIGLMALNKAGGYVSQNDKIINPTPDIGQEWATRYSLVNAAGNSDVQGKKLDAYLTKNHPATDMLARYVAVGEDESGYYIYDHDNLISLGDWDINSINAVRGAYSHNSQYYPPFRPLIGAVVNDNENTVFNISYGHSIGYLYRNYYYTSSPRINDIIYDIRDYNPQYFVCGSRNSDEEDIVFYADYPTSLNSGLDGVTDAYAILKSLEESGPYYSLPHLYLGTEDGIYKNNFDYTNSTPWYSVNNGIGSGIAIHDLVNYNHIVANSPYTFTKPDSIVQYALGHDLSGDPYVYVSPDSGRSWIEFGGYFRTMGMEINDLTTYSDLRCGSELDQPYFLGAATNYGVYKYQYNVFSGHIASNQQWGPGLVIVNGDITVDEGVTLNIASPCTVMVTYSFDRLASGEHPSLSAINVAGTLTSDGPVLFTSSRIPDANTADWRGIVVLKGAIVDLDGCTIDYAMEAINADKNSEVTLIGCTIQNSKYSGVTCYRPKNVIIEDSYFFDNYQYAINVINAELTASFEGNTIGGDHLYGIKYYGDSALRARPIFDDNDLTTENPKPFAGIYVNKDESGDKPIPEISNTYVRWFGVGIHMYNTYDGSIVGPGIVCDRNRKCGINLDHCTVDIIGKKDNRNSFSGSYEGMYAIKLYGKVRCTEFSANEYNGATTDNGDIDFGHGLLTDPGLNSFHHNQYYNLCAYNEDQVYAQGNWWGTTDPQEIRESVSHNVIWDPFLTEPILGKIVATDPSIPERFELVGAYPNPFNATTVIEFAVPNQTRVEIRVFNILGQSIRKLHDREAEPGVHSVVWDGKNDNGNEVSSGVYFYSLQTSSDFMTKKLTLLK
ncbi:MAG: T9SS type A sorting domain-containing protein [candidate division Zixibacteria bacterium]|nr:T9SS type A sorting domain-containing protein [candidate division Zixibacteria bacterium]